MNTEYKIRLRLVLKLGQPKSSIHRHPEITYTVESKIWLNNFISFLKMSAYLSPELLQKIFWSKPFNDKISLLNQNKILPIILWWKKRLFKNYWWKLEIPINVLFNFSLHWIYYVLCWFKILCFSNPTFLGRLYFIMMGGFQESWKNWPRYLIILNRLILRFEYERFNSITR